MGSQDIILALGLLIRNEFLIPSAVDVSPS